MDEYYTVYLSLVLVISHIYNYCGFLNITTNPHIRALFPHAIKCPSHDLSISIIRYRNRSNCINYLYSIKTTYDLNAYNYAEFLDLEFGQS